MMRLITFLLCQLLVARFNTQDPEESGRIKTEKTEIRHPKVQEGYKPFFPFLAAIGLFLIVSFIILIVWIYTFLSEQLCKIGPFLEWIGILIKRNE
uniref:Col_cuticle_N domain-containing protein n=1 Tax=Caenorhabditis tropicalis TaxID=1561998 RepID=A0A1I7UPM7_9PELO